MNVADAVAALFVPGDRPDRFDRALGAGADVVIVDLEDAVAPAAKAAARDNVRAALRSAGRGFLVRINSLDGGERLADRQLLTDLVRQPGVSLQGVVVPKADDPDAMAELGAFLAGSFDGSPALIALVETARGVLAAPRLAAVPGVTRLAFGALDLTTDVDATGDSGPLLGYARAQVVLASRAAGIAGPLDSPSVEITDTDLVVAAARSARGVGFTGSLCIHPRQVAAVRAGFAPTAEELRWARSVVAAGASAARVDGRMVDRPVVERARRLLARAVESRSMPPPA